MARKLIQKLVPDHTELRQRWFLRPFAALLHDPALWHISRRGAAKAFALGLFMGSMPLPTQMALAAMGALILRVNLPIAVATVWFSNPLTMGPIFYFYYKIGTFVLGTPPEPFHLELSLDWLFNQLGRIWAPLWLGSFIMGSVGAIAGYFTLDAVWRISLQRRVRARAARRARENDKG